MGKCKAKLIASDMNVRICSNWLFLPVFWCKWRKLTFFGDSAFLLQLSERERGIVAFDGDPTPPSTEQRKDIQRELLRCSDQESNQKIEGQIVIHNARRRSGQ
jgi:hypothetical protein